MRITFSSLDSILCRSYEIASRYLITWPRRCLPYVAFKNETDRDLQALDHTKNVMFKIKIRSLKKCDLEDQDRAHVWLQRINSTQTMHNNLY